MSDLRARFVQNLPSTEGTQAELYLVEPNGDEYPVVCLMRHEGTMDILGDGETLTYLNGRYGDRTVWAAARRATRNGRSDSGL